MTRLNPTTRGPRGPRGGKRRALGVFERGFTLVEVLVAMIIMGIVGTIIASTIIYALNSTRTAAEGIQSEAQLNDAVARLSRDIATADPILFTSTANGWAANTPSANELWTQTVADDKCIRTRYWIDNSVATNRQLMSTTQYYADDECPDPLLPDTSTNGSTKSIVRALNVVDDNGVPTSLFTYFAKNNAQISPEANGGVSRVNTPKIARIQLTVGANVTDRPGGVRLVTSTAPRNVNSNEAVTIPPPDCAVINLRATNPPWGTAPTVQFNWTEDAARYTLRRIGPEVYNGPDVTSTPYTVNPSPSIPVYTYVDNLSAEAARDPRTITYELVVNYLAGTITCPPITITRPPEPIPSPSNLTVSVQPATPAGSPAWPAGTTQSTIQLNWTACTWCRHFQLEARELNPNTFAVTGGWVVLGGGEQGPGFTSFSYSPGWDRAFEFRVRSRLRDNTIYSASARALTHTAPATVNGNVVTYRQNRVTWTGGGPSTDGYGLLRRVGGGGWTLHATFPAGSTQGTFAEALDTLAEYRLVAFNRGPRGTVSGGANLDYYGLHTNSVTLLQFPAIPTVDVQGTETQPDGTYRVTSGTTPTSTSYEFWEYQRHRTDQTPTTGNRVSLVAGAANQITDTTGNPRGSRQYWMTVACNATGCSENKPNPNLGNFDVGYQRPTAPTITMPLIPTLNSNAVRTTYTRTGDAGEPTDKFCAAGSDCWVAVRQNNAQVGTNFNANPEYTYAGSTVQFSNDWGQTYNWDGRNCNPGGCSEYSAVRQSLHFPGPQTLSLITQRDEVSLNKWSRSSSTQRRINGQMVMAYTQSQGQDPARAYALRKTVQSGDPFNMTNTMTAPVGGTTQFGETWRWVPGAVYRIEIDARARNNLPRTSVLLASVAPPIPGYAEGTNSCNARITDDTTPTNDPNYVNHHSGWKAVENYRYNGYVSRNNPEGAPGGWANASFPGVLQHTQLIGRMLTVGSYGFPTTADGDPDVNSPEFYRWYSTINQAYNWGSSWSFAPFSITGDRGNWAAYTSTYGISNSNSGARVTYRGSQSNDGDYIYGDVRDAGAARRYQLVSNSGANVGDYFGAQFVQNQISEDGGGAYDYACPGGGANNWRYDHSRDTRAASPGSPASGSPFGGGGSFPRNG